MAKLGVVRHRLSTNIIYGFVDKSSRIACIVAQANILRSLAEAVAENFIDEAKVNPDKDKCVLISVSSR